LAGAFFHLTEVVQSEVTDELKDDGWTDDADFSLEEDEL